MPPSVFDQRLPLHYCLRRATNQLVLPSFHHFLITPVGFVHIKVKHSIHSFFPSSFLAILDHSCPKADESSLGDLHHFLVDLLSLFQGPPDFPWVQHCATANYYHTFLSPVGQVFDATVELSSEYLFQGIRMRINANRHMKIINHQKCRNFSNRSLF